MKKNRIHTVVDTTGRLRRKSSLDTESVIALMLLSGIVFVLVYMTLKYGIRDIPMQGWTIGK